MFRNLIIFLFCTVSAEPTHALDAHIFLDSSEQNGFRSVFGKKFEALAKQIRRESKHKKEKGIVVDPEIADLYPHPIYLNNKAELAIEQIAELQMLTKYAVEIAQDENHHPEIEPFYTEIPELPNQHFVLTLYVHGDGNPWIIGRKHGDISDFTPFEFAEKLAPGLVELKTLIKGTPADERLLRIVFFICNSATPFPVGNIKTSFAQDFSYSMRKLGFPKTLVMGFTGYVQPAPNKKLHYVEVSKSRTGGVSAKKSADSVKIAKAASMYQDGVLISPSSVDPTFIEDLLKGKDLSERVPLFLPNYLKSAEKFSADHPLIDENKPLNTQ